MSPENNPFIEKEKHFQKTINRQKRVIIFLALVLTGIGAVYIYNHIYDDSESFYGPNEDVTANPKMRNYRRGIHINKRSMGVYYSVESIRKYLDVNYPRLIDSQIKYQQSRPGKFDYDKYKWMIGFYWMKKKDTSTEGNANKLDFYVIPTLVHKTKKLDVIDYYTDKDSVYYHGKNTQKLKNGEPAAKDDDEDGNAYDEGQLWP